MFQNEKRLFVFLSKEKKIKCFLILFLSIFVSFIEILSISALLPFVTIILTPYDSINNELNWILNFSFFNKENFKILITIIFVFLTLFSYSLRILLIINVSRIGHQIGTDISINCLKNIFSQEYLKLKKRNSSELISTISVKITDLVYQTIIPSLTILSSSVIIISLLFVIYIFGDAKSLLIIFLIFLVYLFLSFSLKKKFIEEGFKRDNYLVLLIKNLKEIFASMKDIYVNQHQKIYLNKINHIDYSLRMSRSFTEIYASTPRFIIEGLSICIISFIALIYSNQQNVYSLLPVFAVFILALQRALPNAQMIYSSLSLMRNNQEPLKKILEILELNQVKKIKFKSKKAKLENFIELKNIEFEYEKNKRILNGINLKIKKGSIIGITGKSGTGKSTLIDILMGLINPDKGSIIIDNNAIFNYKKLGNYFSHVPQKIYLLDESIKTNIIFHNKFNKKLFNSVIEVCNLKELLDSFYNTYETRVGEDGNFFSGGQVQRIGIARALYNKKEVLILDEATNSLDIENEYKIIENIKNSNFNQTVIMISHNINFLRKVCDRTYYLNKGQLKSFGKKKNFN